jgi:hypothetical protein
MITIHWDPKAFYHTLLQQGRKMVMATVKAVTMALET